MKAIILAAGRGNRMGQLTNKQPKCLTELNGKPLIQHELDAIQEAGIKDIAIVTGYKSELLQKYGTHHFHNPRWAETNMVYSLACAQEWLDSTDCIVSYSDIYYSAHIVRLLCSTTEPISIAYDPNWLQLWEKRFTNVLDDAESFCINENDYITDIGRKPNKISEIQGQYMGLLKFSRGTFSSCLKLLRLSCFKEIDMTTFLYSLIIKKMKVFGVSNTGQWGECDFPSDVGLYSE